MSPRRAPLALALALVPTLALGAPPPPPVGQPLPDSLSASDDAGTRHTLKDERGHVLVLVFWGASCPTSQGYAQRLQALAGAAAQKGATFLGVASNSGDDAGAVTQAKRAQGLSFPILIDRGGAIARAVGAAVTPTACVVDGQGVVRYLGAIDDDPAGSRGDATPYLRQALDAVAAGQAPARATTRAVGSRIN